jgi:molybdopterin molybdotransferase
MTLLPVDEALRRLLDGAERLSSEPVPLSQAAFRVLAEPIRALRTQPPFDASAMDGYAVRSGDIASLPVRLSVIGEAAAARRFESVLGSGQAVRIFTGAPVPEGADTILIQENVTVLRDGLIEAGETVAPGRHIRRAGLDFSEGQDLLEQGRLLDPAALSLAAAANHAALPVVRKPKLAILATGDELLPPGSVPGPDQIIASNAYGVAAIAEAAGAVVVDLGIVPDQKEWIVAAVVRALNEQADIVVTLGGASVGDHDLVHAVLGELGVNFAFWKVAMRPGKPLMLGRSAGVRFLGLPGNPVASLVCSHVFLKPLIARLAGREYRPELHEAILSTPMPANDHRQDYVRAEVTVSSKGLAARPFPVQDSSMLKTLAAANGLIIREPHAPAAGAGSPCTVLMLR